MRLKHRIQHKQHDSSFVYGIHTYTHTKREKHCHGLDQDVNSAHLWVVGLYLMLFLFSYTYILAGSCGQ